MWARAWELCDVAAMLLLLLQLQLGARCGADGAGSRMDVLDGRWQRFAAEPRDVEAVEGSVVTLPCRVSNKAGALQWTKDGFGLGPNRALPDYDRYTMTGSDAEGDFSLEIAGVLLEDEGVYQCQVGAPPAVPGAGDPEHAAPAAPAELLRSRDARLTVLAAPQPPRILQGDTLRAEEGRDVRLECVSRAGKPPAKVTWTDSDGNELSSESIGRETLNDSRVSVRSVLRLQAARRHHNTTLTCRAEHPANPSERTAPSASVRLLVKYSPTVKVSVVRGAGDFGLIREGNNVTLMCLVDANPPNVTYKWFLDDEALPGAVQASLELYNVSRVLHDGSDVKCEAENDVVFGSGLATLNISYGPMFRQKPENVEEDAGENVTLTCIVDGNPPPQVTWININNDQIVSNSSAAIIQVNNDTAGLYYCKAHVPGFEEVGARAWVFVRGPPRFMSDRVQWGYRGSDALVECIALSTPPLSHGIAWSFNGRKLKFGDMKYDVNNIPLSDGTRSILRIRESQEADFGTYSCTARNMYGEVTAKIRLRAQEPYLSPLALTGIALAVFIAIAGALLSILCRKQARPQSTAKKFTKSEESEGLESSSGEELSVISARKSTPRKVDDVSCLLSPSKVTFKDDDESYVSFVDYVGDYSPACTSSPFDGAVSGTPKRTVGTVSRCLAVASTARGSYDPQESIHVVPRIIVQQVGEVGDRRASASSRPICGTWSGTRQTSARHPLGHVTLSGATRFPPASSRSTLV